MSVAIKVVAVDDKMENDILKLKGYIIYIIYIYIYIYIYQIINNCNSLTVLNAQYVKQSLI